MDINVWSNLLLRRFLLLFFFLISFDRRSLWFISVITSLPESWVGAVPVFSFNFLSDFSFPLLLLMLLIFPPRQEESPRRSGQSSGRHSAHSGGRKQGGIGLPVSVWSDLQRHVHELWVHGPVQQRPGLLLVSPPLSLSLSPSSRFFGFVRAVISLRVYVPGTERPSRRSRRFTLGSITWFSSWQLDMSLILR